MNENSSVPGSRRDMAMHNDWWASGWDPVLPRQGFPLTTGSLDDLLQEIFGGHWDMIGGARRCAHILVAR